MSSTYDDFDKLRAIAGTTFNQYSAAISAADLDAFEVMYDAVQQHLVNDSRAYHPRVRLVGDSRVVLLVGGPLGEGCVSFRFTIQKTGLGFVATLDHTARFDKSLTDRSEPYESLVEVAVVTPETVGQQLDEMLTRNGLFMSLGDGFRPTTHKICMQIYGLENFIRPDVVAVSADRLAAVMA